MTKKRKQETDPGRNFVYIVEEADEGVPGLVANEIWRKIGIAQASTVKKAAEDPTYGRTRAFNQGNPRGTEVVFSVELHDRTNCKELEGRVHARIIELGYYRLHDLTGKTGHSEWFDIPVEVAEEVIKEEYEQWYLANKSFLENCFGKIEHSPPPTHKPDKAPDHIPVETQPFDSGLIQF